MIILLLESNSQDRATLADSLMQAFAASIYTADTPDQAESHAAALEDLDLVIASVPPGQEERILSLRESLRLARPGLAMAILSENDLSSLFIPRHPQEAAFLKPLDLQALLNWAGTCVPGVQPASSAEANGEAPESPSESPAPVPEAGEPEPLPPSSTPDSLPEDQSLAPLPAGAVLGDYELLEFLFRGGSSDRFIALQRSIDRKVRLRMLRPDWQASSGARERFQAEAKAQAAVRHPQIATVFEAHEIGEVLYYTQEWIQEESLDRLVDEQRILTEEQLLELIKSAAQVFQFLEKNGHGCLPIWPEHLHLLPDGTVKIANTVTIDEGQASEREQLINLAKCVHPLMGPDTIANETIPNLLYGMAGTVDESQGRVLETWDALLEEIQFIETKWREMSGGLTARSAGIYLGIVAASATVLVLLTVLGVWLFQILSRSSAKVPDQLIRIPAGKFIYQDGQEAELAEYWISVCEVTVAQYAEFLDFLQKNPQSASAFDHPGQPSYKTSHEPLGWPSYHKAALGNKRWHYHDGDLDYAIDVNLDCPVTMIDWWDAYAYAKWRGRRLPTEMEWEKAARGRQGNLYPWGNDLDLSKLNSGVDSVPANAAPSDQPTASGAPGPAPAPAKPDGYRFWSRVDAVEGDTSRYLVRGMAGNVSEWTADWAPHPTQTGKEVPVIRGASFVTNKAEDLLLATRIFSGDASDRHFWIGFRTASDTSPDAVPPAGTSPTLPPASSETPAGEPVAPGHPTAATPPSSTPQK